MNNIFRSDLVLEMLNTFGKILTQLDIDFFLVGALARDIRLSVDPAFAPKRITKDVDIAILLASEEQLYQARFIERQANFKSMLATYQGKKINVNL